jgi:hypothetical protein
MAWDEGHYYIRTSAPRTSEKATVTIRKLPYRSRRRKLFANDRKNRREDRRKMICRLNAAATERVRAAVSRANAERVDKGPARVWCLKRKNTLQGFE